MNLVLHHDQGANPKLPSPRHRWTAAGIVVGASVIVATIAVFAGHFALGAAALLFCLLIALLHANAVEPGKLRAPIAAGFLAACSACAALSAVTGAQGIAVIISGWLITGLYCVGLLIGVFKRLDLFQRVLALLLAGALPIALLHVHPPHPHQPPPDWDKWRVALTVLEADGQPVQGARAACWAFDRTDVDTGLINALRTELSANFSTPTDEGGHATIELRADPTKLAFVCGAAHPNSDAQDDETESNPTTLSPPLPVPPARAIVPLELRFETSAG